MFNGLTDAIIGAAISVINLLPESPFMFVREMAADEDIAQWVAFMNWFIPVGTFVSIFQAWLACVALYYVYQIVLRWLKVIG